MNKLKDLKVRSLVGKKIVDILLDNSYKFVEIDDDMGEVTLDFIPKSDRYDNKALIIRKGEKLIIQKKLIEIEAISNDHKDLFCKLLKINTEILPVSVAIDDSKPKKLVLNESLHMQNLDVTELVEVFKVIEEHTPKVMSVIEEYCK